MHYRLAKVVLGIAAAAALPTGASWAAPAPQAAQQESPYKDQGEYDLATAATKETDPHKQIDKIKEWEQKYPDSKLAARRTLMMASALMNIAKAAYGKTGPTDLLDEGAKDAQQILDNLDTYFSAANQKAIGATDEQWKQAKDSFQLPALNVLGWVALQKKDYPKAEQVYKQLLTINPNDAQSAYYLGSAIISERVVARYSEAIYEIAHALSITGPTALPGALQQVAEPFLSRVYATYHGDDLKDPKGAQQVKDDIAKLKQDASAAPFPPAGFHIMNANEIAQAQYKDQAAFDAAHPDIALWRTIRTALTAADGDTYFEKLKDSLVPPAEIGMLKAKIVTVNTKDLVASVDNASGDVTLKFEKPLNQKVLNAGDAFEFKGVVAAYTKEPYMLTVTIDDPKEDIKGLPENAFTAAPARRPPAKKKK